MWVGFQVVIFIILFLAHLSESSRLGEPPICPLPVATGHGAGREGGGGTGGSGGPHGSRGALHEGRTACQSCPPCHAAQGSGI